MVFLFKFLPKYIQENNFAYGPEKDAIVLKLVACIFCGCNI